MKNSKRRLAQQGDKHAKPIALCKGCGQDIVGFATDGYCEDCLCPECGNTLATDNERSLAICEDCETYEGDQTDGPGDYCGIVS